MVALVPFNGLSPGDTVPPMHYSRMRRFWRRGWVANEHVVQGIDMAGGSGPVVEASSSDGDVSVVSAEETGRGWYRIVFSDGTEQRVRNPDLRSYGISSGSGN